MERQYRYPVVAGKSGRRHAIGQLIKFVLAWQAVGIAAYLYLKKNVRKKDPQGSERFDSRPSSEHIMLMMGKNPDYKPPKIIFSSSGVTKEIYVDDHSKTVYKLTLKGFKEKEEEELQSGVSEELEGESSTSKACEEPLIEELKETESESTAKTEEISSQSYAGKVYSSLTSLTSGILYWTGLRTKDES